MTNLDKIFIALLLLSHLLYLTFRTFQVDLGFHYSYLNVSTAVFGLGLNIYYLTKSKFSFHWLLILFLTSEWTTIISKIFHFPGADIINIFRYLLSPIIGITLLATGLVRNKKIEVKSLYNRVVGLILIIQFILPMIHQSGDDSLQLISHYLLIGTILTMKIKNVVIRKKENYLMTLLVLSSLIYILSKLVI